MGKPLVELILLRSLSLSENAHKVVSNATEKPKKKSFFNSSRVLFGLTFTDSNKKILKQRYRFIKIIIFKCVKYEYSRLIKNVWP